MSTTYQLVKSRAENKANWRDYLGLCKLKVVAVMLLTLVVGMCLATPTVPDIGLLLLTNLGVGLAAASAAAVNHVLDQSIDARMARTARRPLPQGRINAVQAVVFAACLGVAGIALLALWVNPLTAWLTLASLIGYAFVYTAFLKRATPQNIVIGGVAGAAPPLLGWVAVTNQVSGDGLLLMLIIFAWTPPHFWALCIARKDDYARAGIPMLPNTHGEHFTRLQILLYTVLTILMTLLPWFVGLSGYLYLLGVTVINARFLYWAWRLYRARDAADPMKMFHYSILYIMGLFAILLVDHYWITSM
ncbi:Cytochrome oxidase biogenesis protein Sco1/SenC/PrrC, putative copper metallochaperone [Marinobacterium lacunae]|uniref:Protoheme IX farnesyltransferase n=1 Tax=Marinobacterium lacunae TaxID=1232683 RepID=A0A081FWR6_9GAMM|nr:heme o synthase [Marinobacterium lacunae]KEA62971.1 Cytochrome oxidase biogenesis protein Sco1/SenC/PrrC, putative copper metallochaperone [Marinobacterium lacunae]